MNLPDCDICLEPQIELGALWFDAPISIPGYPGLYCRKWHVCVTCSAGIDSLQDARSTNE